MSAFMLFIQAPSSFPEGLPSWLTSGPVPVILSIIVILVIIFTWINFRLKRIQINLHELGKSYYEKERIIMDDFKAGRLTQSEYRKKHERLVSGMREESRKITDGPP